MTQHKELKTQAVLLGQGRSIYKQPTGKNKGSANWYSRVHMWIGGKYTHTRSTGTTDVRVARGVTEKFYGECLMRRQGIRPAAAVNTGDVSVPLLVHRFDRIVDEWLNEKMAAASASATAAKDYHEARKLCLAPNGLCAFFKRMDVQTIKTDNIRQYLQFAVAGSKKGSLAPTTQRNHLSTLSSILKFAWEKGYIAAVPPMPKMKLTDNPRPPFTRAEFARLCASAGGLARIAARKGDQKGAGDWLEMEDFLIFMVATFLRAGEWKELRQKHCRYVGGPYPYIEITLHRAKTGPRKVVSMPEAINAYSRMVEREGDDPERFLFRWRYANRDTAQQLLRNQFDVLLDRTGLAHDEDGNKRTLYSLRHTSLMLRLIEGENVDLLMLARNAGTSLDMLQRFYLNRATAAMKVENLHSVKAPVPPTDAQLPSCPDAESNTHSHIDVATGLDEPADMGTGLELELERACSKNAASPVKARGRSSKRGLEAPLYD